MNSIEINPEKYDYDECLRNALVIYITLNNELTDKCCTVTVLKI